MAMIAYQIFDTDNSLMAGDVSYTANPERLEAVKRIDDCKVRELAIALGIPGGSQVDISVYTEPLGMPDASNVMQYYHRIWI